MQCGSNNFPVEEMGEIVRVSLFGAPNLVVKGTPISPPLLNPVARPVTNIHIYKKKFNHFRLSFTNDTKDKNEMYGMNRDRTGDLQMYKPNLLQSDALPIFQN